MHWGKKEQNKPLCSPTGHGSQVPCELNACKMGETQAPQCELKTRSQFLCAEWSSRGWKEECFLNSKVYSSLVSHSKSSKTIQADFHKTRLKTLDNHKQRSFLSSLMLTRPFLISGQLCVKIWHLETTRHSFLLVHLIPLFLSFAS